MHFLAWYWTTIQPSVKQACPSSLLCRSTYNAPCRSSIMQTTYHPYIQLLLLGENYINMMKSGSFIQLLTTSTTVTPGINKSWAIIFASFPAINHDYPPWFTPPSWEVYQSADQIVWCVLGAFWNVCMWSMLDISYARYCGSCCIQVLNLWVIKLGAKYPLRWNLNYNFCFIYSMYQKVYT